MFKKRLLSAIVVVVFVFCSMGMPAVFAEETATLAEVLTWDVIANNQIKSDVINDLNLISKITLNGVETDVVWSSSNASVITAVGDVTRKFDTESVTLTATAGEDSVAFDVLVTSLQEGNVIKSYTFDDAEVGTPATEYDMVSEDVATGNAQFVVKEDNITGNSNKALALDIIAGRKTLPRSVYDKTGSPSFKFNGTTADGVQDSFTIWTTGVKYENEHGTYYIGGRDDAFKYWCGVYVDENNQIIPELLYSYNGTPYICEDGSPYIGAPDNQYGYADSMNVQIKAPSVYDEDGGVYSVGFRFGQPKLTVKAAYNDDDYFDETRQFRFSVSGIGLGLGFNTIVTGVNGNKPLIKFNNEGITVEGGATAFVGKTSNVTGILDSVDQLETLPERKMGEWADIIVKTDFDNDSMTLYYNGRPVFWEVTSNGVTKYSSDIYYGPDMNSAYQNPPKVIFYSDRFYSYMDSEYLIDDITVKYISRQEQAEAVANALKAPYVRTAFDGSTLLFDQVDDIVSYSSNSEKIVFGSENAFRATAHPTVGFGTENVTVTATVAIEGATATKDFTIKLDQKKPYEINAVNIVKDGSKVFTPAVGSTITSVNLTKNIEDDANVVVAAFNQEGKLIDVKKAVAAEGDVVINLAISEAASYKAFVFNAGTLEPYALKNESLAAAEDAVKMFVLGDNTGFSTTLGDMFTENVSVDAEYGTVSAKEALSEGGFDYVLENSNAGDYVVISLSSNDVANASADEYEIFLTQIVKEVQDNGMIAVVVTSSEDAAYIAKAQAVATAFDAPYISAAGQADVAAYIATQIKAQLLPIANYVK